MQELVGRLTALDPEASESLKVIAYFDALVDGHAGPEILLRGAAVLSGCAAGFASVAAGMQVDSAGLRTLTKPPPPSGRWPEHRFAGDARVWIERDGAAHANDAMILERLAIGLSIALERLAPAVAESRAAETVIDPEQSLEHRLSAAVRLRIDANPRLRAIAQPIGEPVGRGVESPPATVVITPVGPVRAVVADASEPLDAARAGLGTIGGAESLDRSWLSALLSLRLTSPRRPVRSADELGSLLLLAEAADSHPAPHPDRVALERLLARDVRTLATVESLIAHDSMRAAALEIGVHHSTLQARSAELSDELGYDIRSPEGCTRLTLALSLHLLAINRFE